MQALFVLAFVLALREAGAQSRLARAAAALRPGGADRGRLRLHLQLPGAGLAGRRSAAIWMAIGLARDRSRDPRARRPGARSASALLALRRPRRARGRADGRIPQLRDLRPATGPASATSSARSRPSRRSGSGPRATSGSRPAPARCRRSATTSAPPSPRSCSLYGLVLCWRRRETAIVSGLARRRRGLRGRPRSPAPPTRRRRRSRSRRRSSPSSSSCRCCAARSGVLYALAAGGCSLLALANAPVGPTDYSPALTELRPLVADGSTLVLASDRLLEDEQGDRYIVWELRGGRVCVEPASEAPGPGGRDGEEAARRRPLRRHRRRRAARRPSPACACAATPTPTCSGKRRASAQGQERLPADRRPPGPPGPRPLTPPMPSRGLLPIAATIGELGRRLGRG